jgi:peptidoglycan/xylan/chitin deacetylase (PgdA/CDA1 family)
VVQNSVFIRRQQKVSILALLAALGSFATGVMLPWNLRVSRALPPIPSSDPSEEVLTPPTPSQPVEEEKQSPASDTTSAAPETELKATPTTASVALKSPAQTPTLNGTFKVETAINRRVEQMQTKLVKLEKQRFHYPVPQQFQGKKVEKVTLKNNERVIALTFDDGPWPETTEQVLEILQKHKIKATFFWVGMAAEKHPEIAKKVAQAGHEIANHTWSHKYEKMSPETAAWEIDEMDELIEELTGIKTTLFRPPGGVQDNGLVDYIYSQNYVNVMWSSDSFDWNDSAQQIVDNVVQTAKPGGIILMHDGGGDRYATVEALPDIIEQLKEQGYRFVTVNELLHLAEDQPNQDELEAQQSNEPQQASRLTE